MTIKLLNKINSYIILITYF